MELIPLEYYSFVYYFAVFVVTVFFFQWSQTHSIDYCAGANTKIFGWALFWILLLFMGLRPIDGSFVDMTNYARTFNIISNEEFSYDKTDFVFYLYTFICTRTVSVNVYFFLCAILYLAPVVFVCQRIFGDLWGIAFLFFLASFSFWAYGVNGIRNGIATSVFLLSFGVRPKYAKVAFVFLAIGLHFSMLLPALALLMARLFPKTKIWILFWLASIPLSLIGGSYWGELFSTFDIGDDRTEYLITAADDRFRYRGFRFDFLIYSSIPVVTHFWFFRNWKENNTYNLLINTYLVSNAVWILLIYSNFSNRFAYLSWFLMPLVLVYPFLASKFPEHEKWMGLTLLVFCSVQFLFHVILPML